MGGRDYASGKKNMNEVQKMVIFQCHDSFLGVEWVTDKNYQKKVMRFIDDGNTLKYSEKADAYYKIFTPFRLKQMGSQIHHFLITPHNFQVVDVIDFGMGDTRWAPASYNWSYNPYKWPYN